MTYMRLGLLFAFAAATAISAPVITSGDPVADAAKGSHSASSPGVTILSGAVPRAGTSQGPVSARVRTSGASEGIGIETRRFFRHFFMIFR